MKPAIRRVLTSKYFLIPVTTLLFYTLMGFVVTPLMVRWAVVKYARDSLKCEAVLSEVRMNPFLLTFEARGFEIRKTDGTPLAAFERFFADLEIKSVMRWALIFRELTLEKPVVHAIVEQDGGLNLQALVPKREEVREPEKPDSKPFRMLLQSIAVLGGKIGVVDKRQSEPAELIVEMFDLRLTDLSTLQDYDGKYLFTTTTTKGEKFEWQGEITLAPFRSSGRISIAALRTATLWEFFRDALNLEPPGGLIDITGEYRFDASCSPTICVLEGFHLGLSDLSLKLVDSDQAFLGWKQLEVDAPSLDLVGKTLQVSRVLLDGCALDIRRDPSGRMNLVQALREVSSREGKDGEPAPEAQPASPAPPAPAAEAASAAPAASPFLVNTDAIEIKTMSVAFDDANPKAPVKGGVSSIDLNFKASLWTGAQGSVTTGPDGPGEMKSSPLALTLEGLLLRLGDVYLRPADSEKAVLELKKLELDAPRLDLGEKVAQVSRLQVEGGSLDVRVAPSGFTNLERMARELGRQQPEGSGTSAAETPPEKSSEGADERTAGTPFKVSADAVDIQGITFALSDLSRAKPLKAQCSDIGLHFKANIQAGAGAPGGIVSGISSDFKEIQLGEAQSPEPLFRAARLAVEGGECDLGARSVVVPRIALSDGHVDVSRDGEGQINWVQLFAAKDAVGESPASKPSSSPDSSADSGWKVLVKSFEIEGFRSRLSDLSAQPDKPLYDVQGFKARLSDVDGRSPLGFSVDFQVGQGGSVSLSGKVDPKLPAVEAEISVSDFVLTPLQPFLEPFLTLVLRSAAISTKGRLSYALPGGPANLAYDGSFKLSRLNLTEPDSDRTYLGLEAAQIPRMKLTLQPDRFDAEEVKLSGLVGELIIAEDKSVNLTRVVKSQGSGDKTAAASQPRAKEEREAFPFRIGKVQVDDGNVVFADLSLKPKFNARIHGLKGVVTGLSSAKDARARIQLDGRVDRFGLAKINGVIQLYDFQRSTEIDMVFRNVEMTTLSPYSGKFAGRQIKSGKLSTDLKYRIQNRKLVGDNKIIVDNLVLGEHVDSPDAVNLPLDLALALLKDSQGRIDLGLPVSGDLDNPEFSIGPLIWKTLVSVITRAVTAPFRALGSLFGGKDEEFSAVEFEPGSAELLPPEREKLQKLADALTKRPQLKLILLGTYSPTADGAELKDLSVRRTIATRLGSKLKPEEDPGPLDLTDSDTRKRLEELFGERFGEKALKELEGGIKSGAVKPRTSEIPQPEESKRKKKGFFSRMANNLKLYKIVPGGKSPEEAAVWSGELYLRLVESEPLAEEELLKLAAKRAQAAAGELNQAGKIPTERFTIEKPEPLSDDAAPVVKLSLGAL
jgi:uncharacterized protein involved in outer membrane biogenesis